MKTVFIFVCLFVTINAVCETVILDEMSEDVILTRYEYPEWIMQWTHETGSSSGYIRVAGTSITSITCPECFTTMYFDNLHGEVPFNVSVHAVLHYSNPGCDTSVTSAFKVTWVSHSGGKSTSSYPILSGPFRPELSITGTTTTVDGGNIIVEAGHELYVELHVSPANERITADCLTEIYTTNTQWKSQLITCP